MLFNIGVLLFLVGHLLYVISFISLAKDVSENKATLQEVMNLKAVYIIIWHNHFISWKSIRFSNEAKWLS